MEGIDSYHARQVEEHIAKYDHEFRPMEISCISCGHDFMAETEEDFDDAVCEDCVKKLQNIGSSKPEFGGQQIALLGWAWSASGHVYYGRLVFQCKRFYHIMDVDGEIEPYETFQQDKQNTILGDK